MVLCIWPIFSLLIRNDLIRSQKDKCLPRELRAKDEWQSGSKIIDNNEFNILIITCYNSGTLSYFIN